MFSTVGEAKLAFFVNFKKLLKKEKKKRKKRKEKGERLRIKIFGTGLNWLV